MKKILFFIESLGNGGAEKILADIVNKLDKNKYDITVLTVTDEGVYQKQVETICKYISFLKQADFRKNLFSSFIYRCRINLIYRLPTKIVYRLLIREKYDVEVAFVEGFSTKLIGSSFNTRSKKISWVHIDVLNNPHADRHFSSINAQTKTYKRFDHVLCVSKSVQNAFLKKFPSLSNSSVQFNPIDSERIVALGKEKIDLAPSSRFPRFVTVGRLEEQKGYSRLINVLAELRQEGFSFSLLILGEGSKRSELETLIHAKQLDDCVFLMGHQSNPYKYISNSDAFVCSSYAEGFSTAATEAIVLGKPVFTTDCAGMKELFGNEECGIIVDNTENALKEMLKYILSDPNLIRHYAIGAEQRSQCFKMNEQIDEIEKLLDE